jgi:hypothetical protein
VILPVKCQQLRLRLNLLALVCLRNSTANKDLPGRFSQEL